MAFKISNALATAKAQAAKDLLDGGFIRIYSGAAPANVDDAETGTLLAEFPMESPAFGSIVNGVMSLAAIDPATGLDDDDAGYFRAYSGGSPSAAVCQGTVGETGAEMIVNDVTITTGQPLAILSWVYTQPKA